MSNIPTRRHTETWSLDVHGETYHISASFDLRTFECLETWCYGPKVGSAAYAICHDICWGMSHELQDGREIQDLARYCMRDADGRPLSIKGVIVDSAITMQRQLISEMSLFEQEVRNG